MLARNGLFAAIQAPIQPVAKRARIRTRKFAECLERISQVAARCGTRQQRSTVERSDLLDLIAQGNGQRFIVFLLGGVRVKYLLAPLEHGLAVLAEVRQQALITLVR